LENQLEIQLGQYKNAFSVNADNYNKISLSQKVSEITEYDIRNILNVSGIFEEERQSTNVYRIYGKIQFLSLLNGLSNDYGYVYDLFLQKKINIKNIVNSFDFYLLKAGTGYTYCSGATTISGSSSHKYVRYFDVIATPNDFEIYPIGFSNNVFGEQDYAFNFNSTFNIDTYLDNFGFPATELFLYPVYKVKQNKWGTPEVLRTTIFDISGNTSVTPFYYTSFNVGDRIYGDLINYVESEFFQSVEKNQTYYISMPLASGTTTTIGIYVSWKYNPFISVRLRYFNDDLETANISGTSYAEVSSIPYYATYLGDGNYTWRNILDQGYFDPFTGLGVDYPFVNKKRYLFQYTILDVIPNLDDPTTLSVFKEINFPNGVPISHTPISPLTNAGKPCL
jgi:hypothetical protein